MHVSPVLNNLLRDLRAGRFRPRAIRCFLRQGIRHAIDIAWSLDHLRHSFYLASAGMLAVLAAVGIGLEVALPEGLGMTTLLVECGLYVFVFGLTLLQLGLVRAETSGEVYDRFVFPNVLTLLRLLFIPYLVRAFHASPDPTGHMATFALVSAAVATDTLDGMLSRRLGVTSDFGRIYDPVVDLCFHSTLAVTLFQVGAVPCAYMVVVLVRFLLPPTAGTFLYLFSEPFQVKSTVMGKVSSLVLSVFIMAFSAGNAFDSEFFRALAGDFLMPASIVACSATIIFFFGKGMRIIKRARKTRGRKP